jgi:hypothetical protein
MKPEEPSDQKYAPSGTLRTPLGTAEFFGFRNRWNEDCGGNLIDPSPAF